MGLPTALTAWQCGGGATDFLNVTNLTVTFDALQTSRSVAVRVCKDSAVEANETYQVRLSTPSFATCVGGDCTGQGTIQNDDSTSGTFAIKQRRRRCPSTSTSR